MPKNYENNKLYNQRNSHTTKPVENTFQNDYILIIEFHVFACLWL